MKRMRRGVKRVESIVPSPCKKICAYEDNDYCIGCGRTPDEIREWIILTDEEKLVILRRIESE
jgi:predicted Fe-S protein YdhL (DUF1289 family)